jgi:hypothetical protein
VQQASPREFAQTQLMDEDRNRRPKNWYVLFAIEALALLAILLFIR